MTKRLSTALQLPSALTFDGRAIVIAITRCRSVFILAISAIGLALTGCATVSPPLNQQPLLFDPEKSSISDRHGTLSFVAPACPPPGTAGYLMPFQARKLVRGRSFGMMRFSPGDRFNLAVFGASELSGDYVVNADGLVVLPYATAISAVGLTYVQLRQKIERTLVRDGLFASGTLRLSVRPVQYAPINVTVAGAVFFPGRHAINTIRESDKLDKALSKYGDSPMERFVSAALRAAGGVRPDADLSGVKVVRDGRVHVLDWRGAITGARVEDAPLIEGDHIEVPESGCFQSALVRPSQVTIAGIRIFTSNLTVPALTNAQATTSPQLSNSVPYGTRLLQGLVSANCVGGTRSTNAARHAVLISRNPKTLRTEVVQRSVEELVRSPDRDMINPYLMPDDAIACYDSTVTEMRDVLASLQVLLNPALAVRTLITPISR